MLPPLSEAQIRQGASDESFARGASYYQGGAVGPLVLRDGLLQAEVEGSEYEPYQVAVSLDAGGVCAASCTCPYDWGGWCKHIVATLLAYAHAEPGAVQVRPPLAELLAGLDRGQLEALLLRLAVESPALTDRIDALVAAPPPVVVPPVIDSERRMPVDIAVFHQQIHRIFRSQRYDDYMAYEGILAELRPLVAQIRSFLDG
ncbi:MAG: SWIM zinc finger domain-containing protein, partial [Chloroflexales bacterium]|nr:SWIM zinc finger domain-containing protein [Chloroflexales bacterium]